MQTFLGKKINKLCLVFVVCFLAVRSWKEDTVNSFTPAVFPCVWKKQKPFPRPLCLHEGLRLAGQWYLTSRVHVSAIPALLPAASHSCGHAGTPPTQALPSVKLAPLLLRRERLSCLSDPPVKFLNILLTPWSSVGYIYS